MLELPCPLSVNCRDKDTAPGLCLCPESSYCHPHQLALGSHTNLQTPPVPRSLMRASVRIPQHTAYSCGELQAHPTPRNAQSDEGMTKAGLGCCPSPFLSTVSVCRPTAPPPCQPRLLTAVPVPVLGYKGNINISFQSSSLL